MNSNEQLCSLWYFQAADLLRLQCLVSIVAVLNPTGTNVKAIERVAGCQAFCSNP